jgi:hypothetical protein
MLITTKYLGPTDTRGSRIKASCDKHSITVSCGLSVIVPYDHALDSFDNHAAAARALAVKLKAPGTFAFTSVEHGYVFIRAIGTSSIVTL